MTSLTRLLAATVVAIGLLVGVLSVRPAWLSAAGLDFWSLPELYARLESENRQSDELDQRCKGVFRRIESKQDVLQALNEGHLSLVEAAARFGEFNRQEPETMAYIREMYAGQSDEERLCRQVLSWVRAELSVEPDKTRATLARLEAEMEAYLKQHESAR
jgi:hypothetical protein